MEFSRQNIGMGCHFFFQGIFPTQVSNLGLLHYSRLLIIWATTEWSKLEREKQISDINAYIWNLERWYQWSYLQGNNEDRHKDQNSQTGGKGVERGEWGKWSDSQWEFTAWLRELKPGLCNNLEAWDGEGAGGRLKTDGIYVTVLSHADIWQKPT